MSRCGGAGEIDSALECQAVPRGRHAGSGYDPTGPGYDAKDFPSSHYGANAPSAEAPPFQGTKQFPQGLLVGLDIGSTTIKAVVVNPLTGETLWRRYQRHETQQPEKCLEFLKGIEETFPETPNHAFRIFATGSGGAGLARRIGGCYVQEVNAVSLAVERFYPDAQSAIELGGQDAKIIIFKEDSVTGRKKKIPSMNDKCAGGTGAVIDKINAKLKIPVEELCTMGYEGLRLHPVAGKCGVFAETDINGLQKQGVPPDELMASLFESIVQQNLSVLTRGHTLRPVVLLLGGPNFYIRGMVDCWRHNIPLIWEERNTSIPEGKSVEDLIIVPDNAQYFAALGAVQFARNELEEDPNQGVYLGRDRLEWFLDVGRSVEKRACSTRGLVKNRHELEAFKEQYRPEPWQPRQFKPGTVVEAFVGVDGGSTSTKAVLVDGDKNVIAKTYQLSQGNPIEDCIDMFANLEGQIARQGCTLEILGAATTGYAKDILKDVIAADAALVETVAHTQSGLHFYPEADVICDIGGQDIKVIMLKNGAVKDFKLNTQCSAGNGYFLQATAADFGYDVADYGDTAFTAEAMPEFGYGCAVFMQSDIVDFQRQGWQPNEIMAGLAAVLPKNIWLYVSQIPNLAKLGSTFILQGGTQHNLAAVKAQVDFIRARFKGIETEPTIIVHKHCAESGAIGCAFEAHRLYHETGRRTTFIGLHAVRSIQYRTTRNENTRCQFCKNKCMRTFVDVKSTVDVRSTTPPRGPIEVRTHPATFGRNGTNNGNGKRVPGAAQTKPPRFESKVPRAPGELRLIIANCEKGAVEDVADMKTIKKELDALKTQYPDLVHTSARMAFRAVDVPSAADAVPTPSWFMRKGTKRAIERRRTLMEGRRHLRIGMPRAMNLYAHAPFFMAYFQSLGLQPDNLVWSDVTSEELYKEGARRGSIDPCFPSKLAIPHIHNLLYHKHKPERGKPLHYILFPMIDSFPTWLDGVENSMACPTSCVTPEATHAAFIKESDVFAERGIAFKKTFLNLDETLLCARQMHEDWHDALGISEDESLRATQAGLAAIGRFVAARRTEARSILDRLEAEDRLGIVVLGRPYHNDPGINHGICAQFQKLGYPIFTQESLPVDDDLMERLFGDEVRNGDIRSPFDIQDVWKNAFSENASRKLWAAKFVARHPNLVGLELSNFKCGHDAPIYTVIEEIIENSGTPFFYFKDIDENRPVGSIKVRIETIAYFLKRYQDQLFPHQTASAGIRGPSEPREGGMDAGAKSGQPAAVA